MARHPGEDLAGRQQGVGGDPEKGRAHTPLQPMAVGIVHRADSLPVKEGFVCRLCGLGEGPGKVRESSTDDLSCCDELPLSEAIWWWKSWKQLDRRIRVLPWAEAGPARRAVGSSARFSPSPFSASLVPPRSPASNAPRSWSPVPCSRWSKSG